MWPRNDLIELLGITHPIIQAPMAGSTTPELAAAVANAGGLGSLGMATCSTEKMRDDLEETRALTNRAVNVNFFVHDEPDTSGDASPAMRAHLAGYYAKLGLGEVAGAAAPFTSFDDERLEIVLAHPPRVVSFHFGLPGAAVLRRVKESGATVLSSATTPEEARILEAGGADAIIAQGYEAGGHRGTFAVPFEAGEIGTMALVPQVVDAVSIPVIAAGGIADGRGIAAAFALGASGVQMGTAFLDTPEAATDALSRGVMREASAGDTRITRSHSGRPARGVENRLMRETAAITAGAAPFPAQYGLTGPLSAASRKQGSPDFVATWSGQAVAMNRQMPAAELLETLVAEAQAILGG
jgi:nitronate monooxygenase